MIENWLSSNSFEPRDQGANAGTDGRVRVAYVGWIEQNKGSEDLLEALRILTRDHGPERIAVDLIGDGSRRSGLVRTLSGMLGEENVFAPGWLSPDAVAGRLQGADVLVLPSHAEGMPNVVLEAMACGLAVVVTAVGCVPDIVQHEVSGIVVSPKAPEELAGALARLVGDDELRARMGANAIDAARARFSLERASGALLRAVEGVA